MTTGGERTGRRRAVAVFDVGLPPAMAFIRSLGQSGVPITAYSNRWSAAGRFSKYVVEQRRCPPKRDSEEFVVWLAEMVARREIDLIAPTSDTLAFSVGEALDHLGASTTTVGLPPADGIRTCLFKGRFADALADLGFPTPPAANPQSLSEAIRIADDIGYPVMIKPRSHVGIGTHRGMVVWNRVELEANYQHYDVRSGQHGALRHVPLLALPILQKYFGPGTVEVVSLTGCLDRHGNVLALSAARKVRQLPPRFGVGTLFEPIELPEFTDDAVHVVRSVLGRGIFELEVLVEPDGSYFAIDLNPRCFGQVSLDIARGHDLPRLWYEDVSGEELPAVPPRIAHPAYWQDAVPLHAQVLVDILRGPDRRNLIAREWNRLRLPRVGAAFDRTDPIPGLIHGLAYLRHPRAFGRRLLTDVEVGGPGEVGDERARRLVESQAAH